MQSKTWLAHNAHKTHISAYPTTISGHTHNTTHTVICLPDRTRGGHTRQYNTHSHLPARPHRRQISGQRHNTTHTAQPHRRQISGQRHNATHTVICLPDCTRGRAQVRDTIEHTQSSTCPTAQEADLRSETQYNTHSPLPGRPLKRQISGQRHNTTHTPCLPDHRSEVIDKQHRCKCIP